MIEGKLKGNCIRSENRAQNNSVRFQFTLSGSNSVTLKSEVLSQMKISIPYGKFKVSLIYLQEIEHKSWVPTALLDSFWLHWFKLRIKN